MDLAGERNIEATQSVLEGSRGNEQEVNRPDGRSEKSSSVISTQRSLWPAKEEMGNPRRAKVRGV